MLRMLWPGLLLAAVLLSACGEGSSDSGFSVARADVDRVMEPRVPVEDAEQLAAGNAAFAFDLYQVLAEASAGENLFFSPHSISTALAMTYAGARGKTEQEMAASLHFRLPQDRLHAAFNGLDQKLATRGEVDLVEDEKGQAPELHIANATWGDREYAFLDEYLETLGRNYGAGMRLLDFRAEPEKARETINGWVEDQTEDRIRDLIPEGAIDPLTRLVLTNAIYFKASWLSPFDKELTRQGPFNLMEGGTSQVEMITVRGADARYATGPSFQAVELAYLGNQISMLVIVPDEGSFDAVERDLDTAGLSRVLDRLKDASLDLTMPKFEFEWEMSLVEPLKALGMNSAFDGEADFSGMDGTRNLVITDVLHKSFVAVDEDGTEAAAATAVIVGETSAPETVELTIDRPFVFLIRDIPTGAILFVGRVLKPE